MFEKKNLKFSHFVRLLVYQTHTIKETNLNEPCLCINPIVLVDYYLNDYFDPFLIIIILLRNSNNSTREKLILMLKNVLSKV